MERFWHQVFSDNTLTVSRGWRSKAAWKCTPQHSPSLPWSQSQPHPRRFLITSYKTSILCYLQRPAKSAVRCGTTPRLQQLQAGLPCQPYLKGRAWLARRAAAVPALAPLGGAAGWHRPGIPAPALRSLLGRGGGGETRLTPLDGVRALALLWVLGYHAILACTSGLRLPDGRLESEGMTGRWGNSWATQPSVNGDAGVDVFFCLSGTLIGHLWLKEVMQTGRFRYWRFLARRFLRIWPMLAVMVAMGLVAARLSSAPQNPACGSNWWRILLFINNYAPKKCQHGHAWSVGIEFQFYLVSPLLMWAAFSPERRAPRRFGVLLLAAGSLAGVAVNVAVMAAQGPAGFSTGGIWPAPFSYTFPVARSSPYFAGMLCSIVVMLAGQRRAACSALPVVAATTKKASGGSCGTVVLASSEAVEGTATTSLLPSKQLARASSSGAEEGPREGDWRLAAGRGADSTAEQLLSSPEGTVHLPATTARQPPASTFLSLAVECVTTVACDSAPNRSSGSREGAQHVRQLWMGRLQHAADLLAMAAVCGLAYCGVGNDLWIQQQAPIFSKVLQVVGRWAFGWAVAGMLMAVLLGRLRPVRWFLCWPLFIPIAALSYSAYLLQSVALGLLPDWESSGVTSMWVAWATGLLAFLVATVVSLALALPCYLLVERPCTRLLPRGW